MPFSLAIGRPGQGKSLYDSMIVIGLLRRAKRLQKKFGTIRKVALNFHLNDILSEEYKDFIFYWSDPMDLIELKDFDLVVDEISTYFPSDKWKDTHFEVRRMFAQHRKRGMEIFANTQSYKMLDINARRMLSRVYELKKIVGSRSPSATLPRVKIIWGIIAMIELDPDSLEDDKEKKRISMFPDIIWITKRKVDIFDTTEDIKPADAPSFHHYTRGCRKCKFTKTYHI